jgi:hypothetical protein
MGEAPSPGCPRADRQASAQRHRLPPQRCPLALPDRRRAGPGRAAGSGARLEHERRRSRRESTAGGELFTAAAALPSPEQVPAYPRFQAYRATGVSFSPPPSPDRDPIVRRPPPPRGPAPGRPRDLVPSCQAAIHGQVTGGRIRWPASPARRRPGPQRRGVRLNGLRRRIDGGNHSRGGAEAARRAGRHVRADIARVGGVWPEGRGMRVEFPIRRSQM